MWGIVPSAWRQSSDLYIHINDNQVKLEIKKADKRPYTITEYQQLTSTYWVIHQNAFNATPSFQLLLVLREGLEPKHGASHVCQLTNLQGRNLANVRLSFLCFIKKVHL